MQVDASNCNCWAAKGSKHEVRSGEMEGETETAAKDREPNDSADNGPKRLTNNGPDGPDGAGEPLQRENCEPEQAAEPSTESEDNQESVHKQSQG